MVLTGMSGKEYNNKLYLSNTSSTIFCDDDDIPCLQELRADDSHAAPSKAPMLIDCSQPREGTLENLLIWARNHQNNVWITTKVMIKNFRTKKGTIDYPVFRYRLEVVVANDTAHTVIVMFNDTATKLLKCSAESLMGTKDEYSDADDELNLPVAIRNLIGKEHILEIKSHTYYEYGSFESFNCWKINPNASAEDDASSSMAAVTANDVEPSMKIVTNPPTVCTPLKSNEEKKQKGHDLEDSDVDEVSGPKKKRENTMLKWLWTPKRKGRGQLLANTSKLVYSGPYNMEEYRVIVDLDYQKQRQVTQNEVRNQTSAFMDKETSEDIDKQNVGDLINMLDRYSSIAQAFRMARDWCNTHSSAYFCLRLHSERKTTRQYNAPTVSEVAAIIINDFGDAHPTPDIVVDRKGTGPQRISELHPLYMALQYPLLFPYGEDGFHEKIPYHANSGTRKTKRGYVTMKEYYSYIIYQHPRQGGTLLKGGRLFQQYLVDAYTAVKEQRLKLTRNNQDTLRVDLYHNLCDAVTRGDTSAAGLGKRIVLPRTFTGSPRYMMHNYQDAMAICRAYDNPDLFITITSNPKCRDLRDVGLFPRPKVT
ncbi:ATP-dependent DNA helicase PIF1-like protein [Tanacetum coccineum]